MTCLRNGLSRLHGMIRLYHKFRTGFLLIDLPRLLPFFIVDIFTSDDLDELGLKILIFLDFFLEDFLRSCCSHDAFSKTLWGVWILELIATGNTRVDIAGL